MAEQVQNQPTNLVKIHGKDYFTVAGRVQLAHEKSKILSINTEVVPIPEQVVVKATVTTEKGIFTGISAANQSKLIEKHNPFEVAETSAVGRALGFAGFGSVSGIASADEMFKAGYQVTNAPISLSTECTCGTKNKYHAKACPARKPN